MGKTMEGAGKIGVAGIVRNLINLCIMLQLKALHFLKVEGLENDPNIVKEGKRFYNNPTAFAMDLFCFYSCHKCQVIHIEIIPKLPFLTSNSFFSYHIMEESVIVRLGRIT